jgi:NDP-sugar pyrophosphorylase family protein
MSGTGQRFLKAGYTLPKPMIEVEGRTIISHVVDMFPGDNLITFICNNDHLDDQSLGMAAELNSLGENVQIIGIDSHKKGPGYAVEQVFDQLDTATPMVINYCDFTCYWDFADFVSFTEETACDGAIPCYTGFHPHHLTENRYAYVKEDNGWATDIREKTPFTDTPMNEYASSGTYYFKSGDMARHYINDNMKNNVNVNGEYYISLPYKPMIEAGLGVAVYELQHFMQWGTPEDLEEYNYWSNTFRSLSNLKRTDPSSQSGTTLLPMAGAGARFQSVGYTEPKPLIPVSGAPMSAQAMTTWPHHEKAVVITREEVLRGHENFSPAAPDTDSEMMVIDEITEGQASTCSLAKNRIDPTLPMTIVPCDSGALYDRKKFQKRLSSNADVLIWAMRGHPRAALHPEQYGWISESDGLVNAISTKVPLSDPRNDPIMIGTFSFKRAGDFFAAADHMYARDGRINGEFYVDECINDALEMGLTCAIFEVDHYLPWGTPDELDTYHYWQSCFHKWSSHPYRLQQDPLVAPENVVGLETAYAVKNSPRPSSRATG